MTPEILVSPFSVCFGQDSGRQTEEEEEEKRSAGSS